jgi:hypothetical protein
MDQQRRPPIRSGASTPRLSELIVRLEQLVQRLQRFQHRYGTQLLIAPSCAETVHMGL